MSNHSTQLHEPSSWAIGYTAFAGLMMIMIGVFHALAGIAAIWENNFYAVTENYIFQFDVTTWGWIQLIGGVVVLLAGFGVFSGALWARIVGVIVAAVSGTISFMFLPYSPVWSILIIAVDVAVIWALTAHGRDITES
ncbi:MAG: hypothetical protein HZB44_07350 [Actinobacteria bacterium]|nr:hypothetical protein [Actinomycetota bacterium]